MPGSHISRTQRISSQGESTFISLMSHMSYSLNSLKGVIKGIILGTTVEVIRLILRVKTIAARIMPLVIPDKRRLVDFSTWRSR